MRHSSIIRSVRTIALLAVLVGLAGCARPIGTVTGKVTYQGKRLKGGYVTFVSTEGQPSQPAEIGQDGMYTIPTITGGDYKVCVETDSRRPQALPVADKGTKLMGPTTGKTAGFDVPPGYTPSSPADAALVEANRINALRYMVIPPHYKDSDKTDLSYTVVKGEQTYNIELK
jgi:hypothetical protein